MMGLRIDPRTFLALAAIFSGFAWNGAPRAGEAAGADGADGSAEASLRRVLMDLASKAFETRKAALEKLSRSREERVAAFLEAYAKGDVYRWKGRLVLALETFENEDFEEVGKLFDPLTRRPLPADRGGGKQAAVPLDDLEEVGPGPRERRLLRDARIRRELGDPDPAKRLAAVIRSGDLGQPASLPILQEMLPGEANRKIRIAVRESILLIQLKNGGADKKERVEAARKLGALRSGRALPALKELLEKDGASEAAPVYREAIVRIEHWQRLLRGIGHLFSGLSLGSILVLMALGLSIIFGQMGVINMAHGELMMLGAYATYLSQQAFVRWLPAGAFNGYFLCALPASFMLAALAGYLIERWVIRRLYGRPLETLLATWGVSLILIQIVRLQFGDNIGVNSPTWLRGGAEVMRGVVLPYNRLFIIALCFSCVLFISLLMRRTKLGLLIRATTQNREMAASLGVATRRMDGYTFALGAGLAGLAGCALTLIGGVTPDMGQNYIVDSFLVVVTGGVGKLAGAVWAGLGLGCLNKLFEPFVQAVWAKVLILLCVVFFIQKRPSGLFPAKGRSADG